MQLTRVAFVAAFWSSLPVSLLSAHPMGNFSVNHYARILPQEGGAEIFYVLDLAEIPTFELLQKWNLQAASPQGVLEGAAEREAREWVRNLRVTIGGTLVQPLFQSVHMTLSDGVGGMKVMRVESRLTVKGRGKLEYQDRNYAERAGWKEIVLGNGPDKSQALTAYPTDPAVPQPQDLRSSVDVMGVVASGHAPVASATAAPSVQPPQPATPPETAVPAPATAQPLPTSPTPAQSESMGSLKRGDYLSRVLHGGDITLGVGLLCLIVAFGLGALHAFEPGHGKTMVAAYLVGSRGTPKHAVLLGLLTTFTHTISVFALGFVTMFLSRYIVPEKMSKILGVISGISIVWIGGLMLYRRSRKMIARPTHHHHGHEHSHSNHEPAAVHGHHEYDPAYAHVHSHEEEHSHGHAHRHPDHDHPHDHAHPDDHAHHHAHSHDHNHAHDGHAHEHSHPHDAHDGHSHEHLHSHDAHSHEHSHDVHAHDGHSHDGHSHNGHSYDGHSHNGDSHDVHSPEGDSHGGHSHNAHSHGRHSHDIHAHDGHSHEHTHAHDHAHPHHHMPEGDITLGSLVALGASGGLVPCPAALVLLLTCISLGRSGFGVLLLLAFSIGLAIVLMVTGLVVLYARNLLPERHRNSDSGLMRAMPVISAAIIVAVGVVMTSVSLGWLPAVRFLG